jgi:hypothetical protein
MLRRLGVKRQLAGNAAKSAHGPWRLSASPALYYALPNKYFKNLGFPELVSKMNTKRFEPQWYVIRMPGGVEGEAQ